MRHGVQTCSKPTDPQALYMRNMYHEYFWGPFKTEQEIIDAIIKLDQIDPYWDYDPFCIVYGADPLPKDFVFGFTSISDVMWQRISLARKNAKQQRK